MISDSALDKMAVALKDTPRMKEIKAEKERKAAIVGVRMKKAEKVKLQKQAEAESKNLSEFIRSLVIQGK